MRGNDVQSLSGSNSLRAISAGFISIKFNEVPPDIKCARVYDAWARQLFLM